MSRTLISAYTESPSKLSRTHPKVNYVYITWISPNFLDLHILYMKSSEKALSRNYNAQELELFCHNRFYGPLVVAYNSNKQPYYLVDFTLKDLENIEQINRNF